MNTVAVRAPGATPAVREYFDQKWFLKAAEEFKETLKYNPDSDVAMFNLARAYMESGQTEQAEAGLKFLIERVPAHSAALHLLSICYARRARYAEAIDAELKALRFRPDSVEGLNNLGSYYLSAGKTDKAVEAYLKAVNLEPDQILARTNLALAYIRRGAWDDAIQQAKEVIQRDSQRSLAHFYLGQAYLGKGNRLQLARCRVVAGAYPCVDDASIQSCIVCPTRSET